MSTYHICYLLGKELCTGINLISKDYMSALRDFNKEFVGREIIYITKLYSEKQN